MTRRNKRKDIASRRLGVNMWGSRSAFLTKNYPPGVHGRLGYKKLTDYGMQLQAKQKMKRYYGNITEKQFKSIYYRASQRQGNVGQNLIGLLESRLDAFVYRAKLAPTVFAARQIVNHKHVTVNGKVVNIPSYTLRQGDVIEVREKSKTLSAILHALESGSRIVPAYIEIDKEKLKASYVRVPALEDVPYPIEIDPKTVVEFYSK